MTELEERLRQDLRAAADLARAGSLRPLQAPERAGLRRSGPRGPGHRATRWLAPALAMAAVLAIVAVVALAGSVRHQQPAAPRSAGYPRFYLVVHQYIRSPEMFVTATVRDSRTGAVLTTVKVWHRYGWLVKHGTGVNFPFGFNAITVANDDRTFAVDVGAAGKVFLLRVSAGGRAAHVRLLRTTYGGFVNEAALSPDGREIAVGLGLCLGLPKDHCAPSTGLEVISTETGAIRNWLAPGANGDGLQPAWIGSSHVEFFADRTYRILDIRAPGSSLVGDSRPTTAPREPLITTRSKQIPTGHGNGILTWQVVRLSARTGQVVEVLHTFTAHWTKTLRPFEMDWCNVLSVSPGGHALISCSAFGRLDGRHFTPLRGLAPASSKASRLLGPNSTTAAW